MDKKFNIFLIFCVGIGGCLYGYNIGAMSGVLLFVKDNMRFSHRELSLFVASFLLGVAIVMILAGYLANLIGRKRVLVSAAIIAIGSIIFMAYAKSIYQLIAGRFLVGMASGMINIAVPLYISETMPPLLRGRGTVGFQLCLSFGILLSTIISLCFYSSANWRLVFLYELIPAIIFLIVVLSMSESPRWLVEKKQKDKAMKVLLKTRSIEIAKDLLTAMSANSVKQGQKLSSIIHNRRALIIFAVVFSIGVLNQLTGINSILQYDSIILAKAGLHQYNIALIGSVAVTGLNFVMTIVAIFIVDRVERKKFLRFGLVGIIICLLATSSAYYFMEDGYLKSVVVIISLLGFVLFFALSPGALVWSLISEVLPAKIRSLGMAVALFFSSLAGAGLAAIFLPLERRIGLNGIFLLCATTTLIYIGMSFFLPDTNGKTLEEIENNVLLNK